MDIPQKLFDKEFQEILVNNGFIVDCDKDERTTYQKDNLYITLYWDGDITADFAGMKYCISMDIHFISNTHSSIELYSGVRPSKKEEVIGIFEEIGYLSFLNKI